MKIAIIIPAYNAAGTLDLLLAQLLEFAPKHDIMVIDDGSSDSTAEISKLSGVVLIIHPYNKGKGEALRSGFEQALKKGYEAVITLDADGQHDPRYIPSMIDIVDTGHWDIIVGSRRNDFRRMSFARFLSNNITTVVVSLLSGRKIEDSQCGYRLVRRELLESIVLETDGYQMESELLIKAGRRGFSIGHVPIDVKESGTSHIRHLSDTWKFLIMALKSFWL